MTVRDKTVKLMDVPVSTPVGTLMMPLSLARCKSRGYNGGLLFTLEAKIPALNIEIYKHGANPAEVVEEAEKEIEERSIREWKPMLYLQLREVDTDEHNHTHESRVGDTGLHFECQAWEKGRDFSGRDWWRMRGAMDSQRCNHPPMLRDPHSLNRNPPGMSYLLEDTPANREWVKSFTTGLQTFRGVLMTMFKSAAKAKALPAATVVKWGTP